MKKMKEMKKKKKKKKSSRIGVDPRSTGPLNSTTDCNRELPDSAKSYRTDESAHGARGKATKSASNRVPIAGRDVSLRF